MSLAPFEPCPLCGVHAAVIMTCTPCWARVRQGDLTQEDRAKLALYERHARMTVGQRHIFDELKVRVGL